MTDVHVHHHHHYYSDQFLQYIYLYVLICLLEDGKYSLLNPNLWQNIERESDSRSDENRERERQIKRIKQTKGYYNNNVHFVYFYNNYNSSSLVIRSFVNS